ncbi:Lrp/AsnC ligand binding domain-containing protein (plasmid) [Rhizobium sp. B230/85]|nr:Lrp/AsnC ligand binding domain-containing protein [Rhizobium sp. B209b/85]QXZ99929.1 Lrp/AsnC ligand binding domain-containing protein [Rhizobium sp. B230/85]
MLRRLSTTDNILTGEDCFHLKVIVPAPADLERIVDAVAHYGSATTSIVLRSERHNGSVKSL